MSRRDVQAAIFLPFRLEHGLQALRVMKVVSFASIILIPQIVGISPGAAAQRDRQNPTDSHASYQNQRVRLSLRNSARRVTTTPQRGKSGDRVRPSRTRSQRTSAGDHPVRYKVERFGRRGLLGDSRGHTITFYGVSEAVLKRHLPGNAERVTHTAAINHGHEVELMKRSAWGMHGDYALSKPRRGGITAVADGPRPDRKTLDAMAHRIARELMNPPAKQSDVSIAP